MIGGTVSVTVAATVITNVTASVNVTARANVIGSGSGNATTTDNQTETETKILTVMIETMIQEFPVIAAVSGTVKEITIALDTGTVHATLMEMTLKNSVSTTPGIPRRISL